MLSLQVNHTWGQLGVNRTSGHMEMKRPENQLNMSVSQAKVSVESTLPKVTIDQSQCFSEAGRKGNVDLTAEMVSLSKSAMLSSIGRIVDQGNQQADILNGHNAIQDQAYYNAFEQFDREFNYGTIPRSRPKIDVIEGQLDIKVTKGQVTNNTVPEKVTLQYKKGSLEIYLKQRPSIETKFVDMKG